jgi:hypothetical protein
VTAALGKTPESFFTSRLPNMKARQCTGALSLKEIQALAQETELRLHECAVCGTQNLYPIKDLSGDWALEPHSVPGPRFHTDAAFLLGE